jgi:hypothetical protein
LGALLQRPHLVVVEQAIMVETSAADITKHHSHIREHDVLLGRGGATNNHLGNQHFRTIVAEHQQEYLRSRKKEKIGIARRVVVMVQSNGGRFLKRTPADEWVEVDDKRAQEKTSQALREGLDVRNKIVRGNKSALRRAAQKKANAAANAAVLAGTSTTATTGLPGTAVAVAAAVTGQVIVTTMSPADVRNSLCGMHRPDVYVIVSEGAEPDHTAAANATAAENTKTLPQPVFVLYQPPLVVGKDDDDEENGGAVFDPVSSHAV